MDTGQPFVAPETAIPNPADGFKASDNPAPAQARDEQGKFASTAPVEPEELETEAVETDEAEAEPVEVADDDVETEDTETAAEEAQPDAVPMPASWSKDDAEIWSELSPSAKAKILTREGQRDAAINLKFQEAANERRQAETLASEAAANRARYAEAIDQVLGLVKPQQPDISLLDPQSPYYDPDSYHIARAQYEQSANLIGSLEQQREHIRAQQSQDEQAQFQRMWSEGGPKLLETVPDLADPAKRQAAERDMLIFAQDSGIPTGALAQASPEEVGILWKAMQYDRQKAAAARVKATAKPAPKPAQPAIRPGVAPTRSSTEAAANQKAMKRLAQSGSVDDAAHFFKSAFRK